MKRVSVARSGIERDNEKQVLLNEGIVDKKRPSGMYNMTVTEAEYTRSRNLYQTLS
jgi:hypothetical protein